MRARCGGGAVRAVSSRCRAKRIEACRAAAMRPRRPGSDCVMSTVAAAAGEPLHHAAGDVHRRLHVLRRADDHELVGRGDRPAVDHAGAGVAGDGRGDPDPDAVDLHRLRAGPAQLLDRVEHVGRPAPRPRGRGRSCCSPGPLGGDGAVEDADRLGALARLLQRGRRLAVGAGRAGSRAVRWSAICSRSRSSRALRSSRMRTRSSSRAPASAWSLPTLRTCTAKAKPEQQGEDADQGGGQRVAAPAPPGSVGSAGAASTGAGSTAARRPRRPAPPRARRLVGLRRLLGSGSAASSGSAPGRRSASLGSASSGSAGARPARHRLDRLAARRVLRRLRQACGRRRRRPRPAGPRAGRRSCPEHVPADRGGVAEDADAQHDDDGGGQLRADARAGRRGTRSAPATTTLDTKEMTKTFASKIPSRRARNPPKTASRAATTAIGR